MELINPIKTTTGCLNNTVDSSEACRQCHHKQKK